MKIEIKDSFLDKDDAEALRIFFNAYFKDDFILELELDKIIIKEDKWLGL